MIEQEKNFKQVNPHWVKVMEEEMFQIEKNEIWELVSCPKEKKYLEPSGCAKTK